MDASPSSFRTFLTRLQARSADLGRSRRLRWAGAVLGVLVLLFGLLGYFWLPGYLHGRLEQALGEALERPVSLGQVDIQPYILEATFRDLRIGEREGEEALAGFTRLTVNLSAASLWRRALVLDALRLEAPYGRLVRQADGRTNVSDLVEKFASDEDSATGVPPFAINNLEILGGSFKLDDRSGGGQHEITALDLVLPRLASFPGEVERQVQPRFSATLDGAPLNIAGELRPFADTPDGRLDLKFQGLDLARLAAFSPVPLPVKLESALLDADLVLDFHGGEARRLALEGRLGLSQLQVRRGDLGLGLKSLSLGLRGEDLEHGPIQLEQLQLQALAARRSGENEPFLELDKLELERLNLDPGRRQLALGPLGLTGLNLALARTGETQVDLLDTLAALQGPAPGGGSAGAAKGAAQGAASPAWRWSLERFSLREGELGFVDRTVQKAVPLRIQALSLDLGRLDSAAPAPVSLGLEGRINDKGQVQLKGQVDPLALAGDLELDLEAMDLVPLQGWIPHRLNLVLTKGELSSKGRLQFGGQPLALRYQGGGQLAELSLMDGSADRSLLRWQKLELGGLDLQTAPFSLKLDDLVLNRFFARLLVTPEGELQLDRLLRGERKATRAAAAGSAPAGTAAAAPALPGEAQVPAAASKPALEQVASVAAKAAPVPVQLGRIRLDGGSVIFNDQFIKPNYSATLTQLSGQIGPLAEGQRGKLLIQGKVDRTAPLVISGELEPFSRELFLDIKAQARGIDMPGFSPYSGRYLGYRIQKGKLSVDVRYKVEKGQLEASNRIFLDQLTLGEKVDSPDALSLPISLALALLKNAKGEIDIELPISGSINDPQFSIGGIVFKAIMNLLVKAVTSPFTLLGSLFGGGEELSQVDFPAGQSSITPDMETRLQQLAKALAERPALSLEVTGQADPVADSEGYRRYLLERQVKAKKVAADVAQGKSATRLGEVSLSSAEYEKFLLQVYKEARFEKPRNMIGLTKSLPVSEMENLLVTHMQVEPEAYRELAGRRAQAVRSWLVEQGGVAPERVFALEPQVGQQDAGASANRVVFSLR